MDFDDGFSSEDDYEVEDLINEIKQMMLIWSLRRTHQK